MSTVKELENKQILGEGAGAFAIVYKDVWRGTPVAVKRILHADVSDARENGRGEDAMKKLDHPNVVKLYDVESDSTFKYYYLELCSASMDQFFLKDDDPKKYRGPMPPTIEVLYQLAIGLEYIHKMGLVHGDIKPQDVLIWLNPENGQVLMKWADFGLSKPAYEMVLREEEYWEEHQTPCPKGTIKSDVFSEGLVFGYFLLGGVHPFGSSDFQIQSNICKDNPIYLPKIKLQWARDLIQKMLSAQPEKRITSSDVVQELTEVKWKKEEDKIELQTDD